MTPSPSSSSSKGINSIYNRDNISVMNLPNDEKELQTPMTKEEDKKQPPKLIRKSLRVRSRRGGETVDDDDDDDDDDTTTPPAAVSVAGGVVGSASTVANFISPPGVKVSKKQLSQKRGAESNDSDNREANLPVVTPFENTKKDQDQEDEEGKDKDVVVNDPGARRSLFPPRRDGAAADDSNNKRSLLVSPSPSSSSSSKNKRKKGSVSAQPSSYSSSLSLLSSEPQQPAAKRRLIFGKYEIQDVARCPTNVIKVYQIVRKLTGSIGGNSHSGPIYGELTMGSMHKMIDLMIENTGFNQNSTFMDVGSGIGKPNLHVAQYPGVKFSLGIEIEHTRWSLGMTCLKAILDEAMKQENNPNDNGDQNHDSNGQQQQQQQHKLQGNTIFLHKDIVDAKTFDPFTHVYMFSIGFPPPLWIKLSTMWNKSQSPYLICFHSPKDIIASYGFDVEFIAQTQTSMHGSKEGHMGYIYKRKNINTTTGSSDGLTKTGTKRSTRRTASFACDEVFQESWDLVQQGIKPLHDNVTQQVSETMGSERKTRSSSKRGDRQRGRG